MTERILLYTQFAGVVLHNGTTIRQISPLELSGDRAQTNIFYLSNGVKFDADGTGDGVRLIGNVRAAFRVTGTSHAAAQTLALALEGLLNKRDTLVGTQYGASSSTNYSCAARCMVARPILRAGFGMATGRTFQIEVEMAWERFSPWVAS